MVVKCLCGCGATDEYHGVELEAEVVFGLLHDEFEEFTVTMDTPVPVPVGQRISVYLEAGVMRAAFPHLITAAVPGVRGAVWHSHPDKNGDHYAMVRKE